MRRACFLALLLLPGACGGPSPRGAGPGLGGTSWRLVRFQSGDDTVLTPAPHAEYTIAFGTDGRASVRIDCNHGSATWTSPAQGQLRFGPLALTRAFCPPAALTDRFARDLDYVRSYLLRDGRLYLALMADGGIYELAPLPRPPIGNTP